MPRMSECESKCFRNMPSVWRGRGRLGEGWMLHESRGIKDGLAAHLRLPLLVLIPVCVPVPPTFTFPSRHTNTAECSGSRSSGTRRNGLENFHSLICMRTVTSASCIFTGLKHHLQAYGRITPPPREGWEFAIKFLVQSSDAIHPTKRATRRRRWFLFFHFETNWQSIFTKSCHSIDWDDWWLLMKQFNTKRGNKTLGQFNGLGSWWNILNLKIYKALGYIVSLILLNLGHVFRFHYLWF